MKNETNSIQPDTQPETQLPADGAGDSANLETSDGAGTMTQEAATDETVAEAVSAPESTEDDAGTDTAVEAGSEATESEEPQAAAAQTQDSGEEDEDDQDVDDEDEADFRGILEALIFASDEPLTFKQMKELLAPNETDDAEAGTEDAPGHRRRKTRRLTITRVKRAIDRLNDEFAEHGRVFRIVEVAGGFAFQTTKEYGAWVGRLFAERSRRRLTQSALETLAIIAFKQPISKPAIEGIRGVNAEYVVKSLLERNLISIVGREDSPGRPLLYGTTKNFLKHFGLSSINDLPKPREIKDMLSSEEELGVNPIDEMDPEAAALLTRVSSQELEKLFETAQTKAKQGESENPPVLHVQFDTESESESEFESESEGESEFESESEGESEFEGEGESESEFEGEGESESESASESEFESEFESESESESEIEGESESASESEFEGEIEFESESEGESEGESEFEGEGESESEIESEFEGEIESESEFEGEIESESESEFEGEDESEFEGEIESEFEGEQEFESAPGDELEPEFEEGEGDEDDVEDEYDEEDDISDTDEKDVIQ